MQNEEIVFLDSEIVDDDVNAPYGELVNPVAKPETLQPVPKEEPAAPAETTPVEPAARADAPVENRPVQRARSEAPHPNKDTSAHEAWTETLAEEDHMKEELTPTYVGGGIAVREVSENKKPQKTTKPAAKPNLNPWAEATVKPARKKAAPKTQNEGTKQEKIKDSEENIMEKDKTKKTVAKAEETKAPAKTAAAKKAEPAPKAPAKKAEPAPVKKEAAPAKKPEPAPEKVLIEGDDSQPHGKFVIKKTDNGNFVYKLFSSNRRVLASPGGAYKDLASCKAGVQSVIKNAETAPIEDQTLKKWEEQKCPKWVIYNDKAGEVRLRLIASNGNVVAITNDGYLSKDAAKKGIDAIARAAKGASVVRNDDLW